MAFTKIYVKNFGVPETEAGIGLVAILNHLADVDIVAKVQKIVNAFNRHKKALAESKLPDGERPYFSKLFLEDTLASVKSAALPESVSSYLISIIKATYK